MGDDGVGPYCLEVLKGAYSFPPEVELVELGTPGPEFGHILLDWNKLIVIDSVEAEGQPGDVKIYDRQEILAKPPPQRMSPHDPSLRDALLTADFVGEGPEEVVLIGVVPTKIEMGTELSEAVISTLPQVESKVVELLSGWGVAPERLAESSTDIWWTRSDA